VIGKLGGNTLVKSRVYPKQRRLVFGLFRSLRITSSTDLAITSSIKLSKWAFRVGSLSKLDAITGGESGCLKSVSIEAISYAFIHHLSKTRLIHDLLRPREV
jgi:hypothetical protein